MPGINFWMIFIVFGVVSRWVEKALADGKITIMEAADLGQQIGELLGIPTNVTIPTPQAVELQPPKSAAEEYAEAEAAEAEAPASKPRPT